MRYYLTTPIYYVNSTPHIGHAYTTCAADILVRHQQQRGAETFFLTGVDEHATKVYRVAVEQGLAPQEYVDQIVEVWRELPRRLNAEPDFFIRTSDEGHKRFVREFLQRIHDNGDVYEDIYSGLYCVGCEEFKNPEDLIDGKCPIHLTVPEQIEERNYFFRLSAYQDRLLELYDSRPDFVLPGFRFNEARSFIAGGLQDFSISRAGQPWGIPLPWDEGQVAYVWADALINYLSALSYARPGEDLIPVFWPEARHLMAKDILRFHCIYWPAMLMAAGYDVPKQVFVHGYLLLDDRKISKSFGNVLDPLDLIDVYGADAVRYWCARAVSFGQDGSASIDGIHERYERELGNDLGNLLSRTTAMIARYRGGRIGERAGRNDELAEAIAGVAAGVVEDLDRYDITAAIDRIWILVRWLNRYVTECAPWEIAKDETRAADLEAVLYDLAEGLRVVAIAVSPYLPDAAPRILEALGQPSDLSWSGVEYGRLAPATGVEGAKPLFPRLETATPDAAWIASHAHVTREEATAVLARARAVGVSRVIVVATTIAGASEALAIAEENNGVFVALGVHPHNADGDDAQRVDELVPLYAHERAVAVGETGLDYFREYAPRPVQRRLFERQLEIALEVELPAVIHTRAADEDTLEILAGFPGTVVLHCFSSPALLDTALERGWYVSFAGNLTYPNASNLREAARHVPLDRLLVETDSPYLSPQRVRGTTNEPANVEYTLNTLAEARGIDARELETQIDANATAAFGLPKEPV